MRGKLLGGQIFAFERRIIPARAGQTAGLRDPLRREPDHPRACGANLQPGREGEADAGSSPRVRGKPGPDRV